MRILPQKPDASFQMLLEAWAERNNINHFKKKNNSLKQVN